MDSLHRLLTDHRRAVAAVLAGLAVLTGLQSLRENPATREIVVAARDLASGAVLAEGDIAMVEVSGPVPAHRIARSRLAGRTVGGPMRRGEPFTDRRLVPDDAAGAFGPGTVLVTIRVDRTSAADAVPGRRVDVVAVDPEGARPAEIVARGARVVAAAAPGEDDDLAGIRLAVAERTALELTSRSLAARLSLLSSS